MASSSQSKAARTCLDDILCNFEQLGSFSPAVEQELSWKLGALAYEMVGPYALHKTSLMDMHERVSFAKFILSCMPELSKFAPCLDLDPEKRPSLKRLREGPEEEEEEEVKEQTWRHLLNDKKK